MEGIVLMLIISMQYFTHLATNSTLNDMEKKLDEQKRNIHHLIQQIECLTKKHD